MIAYMIFYVLFQSFSTESFFGSNTSRCDALRCCESLRSAGLYLGANAIIPFAMTGVTFNMSCAQPVVSLMQAIPVFLLLQTALFSRSVLRRRRRDQTDDDAQRCERSFAPVFADTGEEAMLDCVPFTRCVREV